MESGEPSNRRVRQLTLFVLWPTPTATTATTTAAAAATVTAMAITPPGDFKALPVHFGLAGKKAEMPPARDETSTESEESRWNQQVRAAASGL